MCNKKWSTFNGFYYAVLGDKIDTGLTDLNIEVIFLGSISQSMGQTNGFVT